MKMPPIIPGKLHAKTGGKKVLLITRNAVKAAI
jgi:hypothetical protein